MHIYSRIGIRFKRHYQFLFFMQCIRSPICTTLGHVDHGKSSILDSIRGTAIVDSEAGKITQAIGASIIPLETIQDICGDLLQSLKMDFTIPGLLFIDTPGHAAFTNLRKRGGNLADIAILVVDVNEGLMPQTIESIEILKQYKTPFVIAANKIDKIAGFRKTKGSLLKQIAEQSQDVQRIIDTKLYELVGKLAEHGFNSERFDRVNSYTEQIAIIPTSAKEKLGIPELLMVIAGLAQRYLENCLTCDVSTFAKGTVLEVKEEKGLGTTLDVIIYNGQLKVNDTLVIGGLNNPIVTKVRALLEPMPLSEMRDKKSTFRHVKSVCAAIGVKISAPEIEDVIAGMPVRSTSQQNLDKTKREIQLEVEEVVVETDKEGIIVKADSLGSLEALVKLLKEKDIKIRKATVGNITKKDVSDAESNYDKDPLQSVILGFNVKTEVEKTDRVNIIISDIVYKLIEAFIGWQQTETKNIEHKELDMLVKPFKAEIMKGYIFRQNNPAVVGIDVISGTVKVTAPVMKADGKTITHVKSIQHDQESIEKAEKGKQVAVSFPNVTVGRQIKEGDVLYSAIPEEDFRKMKKLKKYLNSEEKEILKEVAEIMRKENTVWGI